MSNTIYKTNNGTVVEAFGKEAAADGGLVAIVENTTEAATEKHIPVVEEVAGGYKVTVGEVAHPMEDVHFIEWIEISDGVTTQRTILSPGQKPQVVFKTDAKSVVARAYCNLHGLWKSA